MAFFPTTNSTVLTGSLSAAGPGNMIIMSGDFNVTFTGSFSATVHLERSFDNGVTFSPITALGAPIDFTGPATEIFGEVEKAGAVYRVNCTAYTSGTINYRISQ